MSKRLWSDVEGVAEGEGQSAGPGIITRVQQNGNTGVIDVKPVKDEEDTKRICLEKPATDALAGMNRNVTVLDYEVHSIPRRLVEMANNSTQEEKVLVEVKIPADYLTNTNQAVKARQLWGDRIYSYDSNIVTVLLHLGFYRNVSDSPPNVVVEARCILQILPLQPYYQSTSRHNLRSRSWIASGSGGCSFKVESCWLVKEDGWTVDLQPSEDKHSEFLPTFAPASFDRVMNTRSTTASAERRQRYLPELSVMFNLCNEPWLKYSIQAVADRGLKQWQWTSARLHSEVLYLETQRERYELTWAESQNEEVAGDQEKFDVYLWSRCLTPLSKSALKAIGTPCPPEYVDVLHPNLQWEEIKWGASSVEVRGVEYSVLRIHFMQRGHGRSEEEQSSN